MQIATVEPVLEDQPIDGRTRQVVLALGGRV